MITAFHDMPTTVRAMKLGAVEYIHKPLEIDEIEAAIERLLKRKSSGGRKGQATIPLSPNFREYDIVGKSRAMKEVFKTIEQVTSLPFPLPRPEQMFQRSTFCRGSGSTALGMFAGSMTVAPGARKFPFRSVVSRCVSISKIPGC
jgi:DNA-binding response OmpR family regulator